MRFLILQCRRICFPLVLGTPCTIYISVVALLLLFACESNSDKIFNAFEKACSDNKINEEEYKSVLESIKTNDTRGYSKLLRSDNSVDNSKVTAYILRLSKAKKVDLSMENIWQPNTESTVQKFNINVYFENSASMNGYVGENSSFKTTVFKLLTDLKNFSATDSLNLKYINTKAITIKENASRDDIDDFYKRLNPADFKRAGGSVASTDIERMLKTLLDKVSAKDLNVFISDCVFSPGKADAKKYLDGQYAAIYNDFTHARNKHNDLSVVILQCISKFEGTYYDYLDNPHLNVKLERPYYIWFIGTDEQIKQLIDNKLFDLIKGGYQNKLVVQSLQSPLEPDYKILLSNKIGSFRLKDGSKGPISDAEISDRDRHNGRFGFNVAVDFSESLQDSKYFLDTTNYKVNKNYHLAVEDIGNESDVALKDYTHKLKLETDDLRSENLNVDVIGQVPTWVYEQTSNDDTNIEYQDTERLKTFGLKYLIEGVCDAFYPKSKENTISTLSITIQK